MWTRHIERQFKHNPVKPRSFKWLRFQYCRSRCIMTEIRWKSNVCFYMTHFCKFHIQLFETYQCNGLYLRSCYVFFTLPHDGYIFWCIQATCRAWTWRCKQITPSKQQQFFHNRHGASHLKTVHISTTVIQLHTVIHLTFNATYAIVNYENSLYNYRLHDNFN